MNKQAEKDQHKTSTTLKKRHGFYDFGIGPTLQETVINELDLRPGMSLLDMGCGYGRDLAYVHKSIKQIQLSGVDIAEEQIKEARKTFQRNGIQCEFTVADIQTYTTDKTFDCILFKHSLHYLDNPIAAIRLACKHLKPNGKLLAVLHDKNDMPLRKMFSQWIHEQLLRQYSSPQEQIHTQWITQELENAGIPHSVSNIDREIILDDPDVYIEHMQLTRHRYQPALSDEQWGKYIQHMRSVLNTYVEDDGAIVEHSISGIIIIEP